MVAGCGGGVWWWGVVVGCGCGVWLWGLGAGRGGGGGVELRMRLVGEAGAEASNAPPTRAVQAHLKAHGA